MCKCNPSIRTPYCGGPGCHEEAGSRDGRFLLSAISLASIWSKDPSTKVCAIAVGDQPNLVAFGYNGFPPGIEDTRQRLNDRSTKLSLTLHAEVNALANAAFPVRTLYVNRHPCENCALHILAARTVRRVVFLHDPEFAERWKDSLARSAEILREGGVKIVSVTF